VHGLAGNKEGIARAVAGLEKLSKQQYVSPFHYVGLYTATGNLEAWREAIRDSYNERANGLCGANVLPLLDSLRSDPVLQEVIRNMGLVKQ